MDVNTRLKARRDEILAHVFDEYLDGYGSEALVGVLRPWNTVEPAPAIADWSAAPSLWVEAAARNPFIAAALDRNVAKVLRHASAP